MNELTITGVEILALRGPRPASLGPTQLQVKPIDLYDEYRSRSTEPARESATLESLYVRVTTRERFEGFYGPISREAAWAIVENYGKFLVGQNALGGSALWDKLQRLIPRSVQGSLKLGISALDNALWDLRGKAYDAPVWQLLGGSGRAEVPAYVSTLGTLHDVDSIKRVGKQLADEGFDGQKWFLAYGPSAGSEGMDRNIALVENIRDALGPTAKIMFDAYTGWDLAYARSWARSVEHLRPTWLEEPFLPDHDTLFAELHHSTQIPLATGEKIFDRPSLLKFLQQGTIAVLQPDPEYCGGVTELSRMCSLAETFGIPIIPHGFGVHAALSVVASQSPETCPKVEYLFRSVPTRYHFELAPPVPTRGRFALSKNPGFGITPDDDKIDSCAIWTP